MRRPELTNLTGIRALAAAWVVVEHFRLVGFALVPESGFLRPWVEAGYLGVEVFFVLSGFIIAYNYLERFRTPSRREFRNFVVARFARIYPTHAATLAIMVILVIGASRLGLTLSAGAGYTSGTLLGNAFMLQALPPIPAWNPPAWSISAEFAAYLAFPLIAMTLNKVKTTRSAFGLAGALAVLGAAAMAILQSDGLSATGGVLIALRITVEFAAGCLLYVGWSTVRTTSIRWAWIASASTVLIGCGIGLLGSDLSLALVPFIAAFVLSCASAGGIVGSLLSSRVMMWGGRISYSVYMTHFIVIMVLPKLIPPSHLDNAPLALRAAVLLAFFAVAVLTGWLCHVLIEIPGRDLVKRLLTTQPSVPA